jgi:hypothetical protein
MKRLCFMHAMCEILFAILHAYNSVYMSNYGETNCTTTKRFEDSSFPWVSTALHIIMRQFPSPLSDLHYLQGRGIALAELNSLPPTQMVLTYIANLISRNGLVR